LGLMFLRAAVAIGSRATLWGHAVIWLDLPVSIYKHQEHLKIPKILKVPGAA